MTVASLGAIIHPTDFSASGLDAFAHALRIAVAAKTDFYIVHLERDSHMDNSAEFLGVQQMLAAWGMISAEAPKTALAEKLGVVVQKQIVNSYDTVRSVATFVEEHPCELLVMLDSRAKRTTSVVPGVGR